MPYPERMLHETESLVLDLHPHPIKFIPSLAALIASLGVGAWVLTWDSDGVVASVVSAVVGVLVLVCLVIFFRRLIEWRSTNFVVTTDRCIYRSGIISKHGVEIPLERINTVFFNQSLFERLVRAGGLTIESGGETGRQEFSEILNPEYVQTVIYHQIEDNENRKFDRLGQQAAGGAVQPEATHQSMLDELAQLADLRDRGVLTDAEFETQKARLLAGPPAPPHP